MEHLQTSPDSRDLWIQYSSKDAIATWWVYASLEQKLRMMPWVVDGGSKLGHLFEFYWQYLRRFGELLTDMEAEGIKVDTAGHLKKAEVLAKEERAKMERIFLQWAAKHCPDAKYINTASSTQIQQLFFGHYESADSGSAGKGKGAGKRASAGRLVATSRVFRIDKAASEFESEAKEAALTNPYAAMTVADMKTHLKERGLKLSGKKIELIQRLLEFDALLQSGWSSAAATEALYPPKKKKSKRKDAEEEKGPDVAGNTGIGNWHSTQGKGEGGEDEDASAATLQAARQAALAMTGGMSDSAEPSLSNAAAAAAAVAVAASGTATGPSGPHDLDMTQYETMSNSELEDVCIARGIDWTGNAGSSSSSSSSSAGSAGSAGSTSASSSSSSSLLETDPILARHCLLAALKSDALFTGRLRQASMGVAAQGPPQVPGNQHYHHRPHTYRLHAAGQPQGLSRRFAKIVWQRALRERRRRRMGRRLRLLRRWRSRQRGLPSDWRAGQHRADRCYYHQFLDSAARVS